MIKRIIFVVPIITLLNCFELIAQSIFTNRENIGVQVMGSVLNGSNDLTATSIGMGLSFNRNVDVALFMSDYKDNPGYYDSYEVFGGGIGFFPIQQWNDHPLTVSLFTTGARSTLRGANGWTFLVGSAITRDLMLSEKFSIIPSVSFSYAPFVGNRGDGSSFFNFEGSITYNLANTIKFAVMPSLITALNSDNSTIGFSFGFIL